jgi:hypothetical protein
MGRKTFWPSFPFVKWKAIGRINPPVGFAEDRDWLKGIFS